jgi:hypothetical protein
MRMREKGLERIRLVKAFAATMCMANCGHAISLNPDADLLQKAPPLMKNGIQLEMALGENTSSLDPAFIRQTDRASRDFLNRVRDYDGQMLLILGTKDRVADNEGALQAACSLGDKCKVVRLPGRHPVHFESKANQDEIIATMNEFVQPRPQTPAATLGVLPCAELYKTIAN